MTSESIVSLLFFCLHIYKGKGLSLSDTCNEIDGLYSLFAKLVLCQDESRAILQFLALFLLIFFFQFEG